MTAKPMPAPDLPPLRIGAVLLAAGSASRMGHRPKCLLEREGRPLIRRQAQALAAAGVAPIVVVLGHYRERVGAALDGLAVSRVTNPDPEAPQSASLHLGLRALPETLDAVIVTLADLPLIERPEIEALIAAWRRRPVGTAFLRPWVDGQPGNPVLFDGSVRDALLAGAASYGGQQWAAEHPQAVHRWTTENRNYITDVDGPQDLSALAAQGVPLSWPAAPTT
jgi:molybdenum cofactor cytidylyltransferase